MNDTTTPPWDIIDSPGWHPLPGGGYESNPQAGYGRMTPIDLCDGDIVKFDTFESGELVGIVRKVTLGATQAVISVQLHTGSRRSILAGKRESAFELAGKEVAIAFRATLGI